MDGAREKEGTRQKTSSPPLPTPSPPNLSAEPVLDRAPAEGATEAALAKEGALEMGAPAMNWAATPASRSEPSSFVVGGGD